MPITTEKEMVFIGNHMIFHSYLGVCLFLESNLSVYVEVHECDFPFPIWMLFLVELIA